MMGMEQVTGPACPGCGCAASEIVSRFERWGKVTERRACDACGRQWSFSPMYDDDEPDAVVVSPVIYHVMTCPKCDSRRVPVQRTVGRTRYHKCGGCGFNFKSVEE